MTKGGARSAEKAEPVPGVTTKIIPSTFKVLYPSTYAWEQCVFFLIGKIPGENLSFFLKPQLRREIAPIWGYSYPLD